MLSSIILATVLAAVDPADQDFVETFIHDAQVAVLVLQREDQLTQRQYFCHDGMKSTAYHGIWSIAPNLRKVAGASFEQLEKVSETLNNYGAAVNGCYEGPRMGLVKARAEGQKLLGQIGKLKGFWNHKYRRPMGAPSYDLKFYFLDLNVNVASYGQSAII